MGKLRGLRHKGWISAVQSSQSWWRGQCKKGVQYDFKFTLIYSEMHVVIAHKGVSWVNPNSY